MNITPIFRTSAVRSLLWSLILLFAAALPAWADDEFWGGGGSFDYGSSGGYGCYGEVVVLPPFPVNGNDPATEDWTSFINRLYGSGAIGSFDDPNNVTQQIDERYNPESANYSNPVETNNVPQNVTKAEALVTARQALALIQAKNPALFEKLKVALANGLQVGTCASFTYDVRNSKTGAIESRIAGGGLIPGTNLLVLVINSATDMNLVASVLVHEITHIDQDASLPAVEKEKAAYHAQYDFMKAEGMSTAALDQYAENGQWSDSKFTAAYTASSVKSTDGGTWTQTGNVTTVNNL